MLSEFHHIQSLNDVLKDPERLINYQDVELILTEMVASLSNEQVMPFYISQIIFLRTAWSELSGQIYQKLKNLTENEPNFCMNLTPLKKNFIKSILLILQ